MTTTHSIVDPRQRSEGTPSLIRPGVLVVIAGAVFADGAFLTAAYRSSSTVADDRLTYPWTGASAVTTSAVWGAAQLLLTIGLIAFARSNAVRSRWGRRGAWVAVTGSALFVAGHVASIVFRNAETDDPGGVLALTCFGAGTVLLALGMLVAAHDVRRTGVWQGWARNVPLALGAWMVAMMPLQFTSALVLAVGVYSALTIALGLAMIEQSERP